MTDTIYALSSAPGKAGVSVVRVSGPDAIKSYKVLINNEDIGTCRNAKLVKLVDAQRRQLIDNALVIHFEKPHSFTGEYVVEYHLHGSPAVLQSLFDVLSHQPNHRLALPGEFTRRAFENGKMDLTEAEAVADLIDAETIHQKNQALAQMGGALSTLYHAWADDLTRCLAYVEAVIDFPDDEVPDDEMHKMVPAIQKTLQAITDHLNDNQRGERLRDGIKVAVIGAPNAGKSSLVNALARRDVAIVSEMAGTTRDVIEVPLNLGGYPVLLFDTAGLRPEQLGQSDQDKIESEGIRRALQKAEEADIRLLVMDGTKENPDVNTLNLINSASILVVNKCDLFHVKQFEDYGIPRVFISAHNAENLDILCIELEKLIQQILGQARETPSLTRRRHREALEKTKTYLENSLRAGLPELMAEELRLALRSLGAITGRVDVEDLLDVIFHDFCIGK